MFAPTNPFLYRNAVSFSSFYIINYDQSIGQHLQKFFRRKVASLFIEKEH